MLCKICQSTSNIFDQGNILNKYSIIFYKCTNCGFIQTETPFWLEESYSNTITKSDIGLLSRNIHFSNLTSNFISLCLAKTSNFVDFGGGYGIFVRLMRDKGFNFFIFEKKCENLFANQFKANKGTKYDLLTAWEVLEHLEDPLSTIEEMLSFSSNILFSTLLLSPTPKPVDNWWYYGLEHGQHISFYTKKSIQVIAEKFNFKTYYISKNLHFLGNKDINSLMLKIALHNKLLWISKVIRKHPKSLIDQDFNKLTGKLIN